VSGQTQVRPIPERNLLVTAGNAMAQTAIWGLAGLSKSSCCKNSTVLGHGLCPSVNNR